MALDWNEIGKLLKPVPNYEDLIKRLLDDFAYPFIKDCYAHNMPEAQAYAAQLLGNDPKQRYTAWLEKLTSTFSRLDELGVLNYLDFIQQVDSRTKLDEFYQKSGLSIDDLIGALKYLLYWVLPSRIYLRELIDPGDLQALEFVTALRENGIRFNLDLLQKGSTPGDRREIARLTGVPEAFILDMVNRSDFTRMPYTRASTARNYIHSGYPSIEKLAAADLNQMAEDMRRYGESVGKNTKIGMEYDSGILCARVIPKVVKD